MNKTIQLGLDSAPLVGINGGFYPHMYLRTQAEWDIALDRARRLGWGELWWCGHDNVGEIGETPILTRNGYEYLYYVDAKGDYCSVAFREALKDGKGD